MAESSLLNVTSSLAKIPENINVSYLPDADKLSLRSKEEGLNYHIQRYINDIRILWRGRAAYYYHHNIADWRESDKCLLFVPSWVRECKLENNNVYFKNNVTMCPVENGCIANFASSPIKRPAVETVCVCSDSYLCSSETVNVHLKVQILNWNISLCCQKVL